MARRGMTPITTVEDLRRNLVGALRFIWRHNGGTNPDAKRARIVAVIELLERHLEELGIDRSLIRPLFELDLAFAEAKRGRLDPLFQPVPLKHRQPTPLSQLWVMALASLAMDLLMAGKLSKEKAARAIAKSLRKNDVPIESKRGISDWKTVIGWRETLRKNKGHRDVLWFGDFYRLAREERLNLLKKQSLNPTELAKQELERLREILNSVGKKHPS